MSTQTCHSCSAEKFNWLLARTITAIVCSFPLLLHMFGVPISLGVQGILASIVQVFCGWPFYAGLWRGLKKKSANMDTLVALGTTAAYLFSFYTIFADPSRGIYFETSSLLISFILLGRLIEDRSKEKAQSGMKALLSMQPQTARIRRNEEYVKVDVDEVKKGDHFMVRPGEKIPVDGNVLEGASAVDESMLSGESIAAEKQKGSIVFAGTLNQHGSIVAEAINVGKETALSRIILLVENAQETKAPIERLADNISKIFVPIVIFVSLLTVFLWGVLSGNFQEGVINAVAVLVIACPCALGLAVPIIILVATSKAAHMGVFIKNAEAIEKAQKIQTLIVDKTNTVTEGTLTLEKMTVEPRYFPLVKTLCEHSEHPAAQAILEKLSSQNVSSLSSMMMFRSQPGKGVSGHFDDRTYFLGSVSFLEEQHAPLESHYANFDKEVGLLVLFGTEKLFLGYFLLSDQVKPGSKEAVTALKHLGIETILMSGDRFNATKKVATQLGFDQFEAEVLPEEKAHSVQEAKSKGKTVGMVGDGVNDAPALAFADVGFAIASGTDVAMESASVGLMRSHLSGVVDTIRLSKSSFAKMQQNLIFAFGYNVLGIPLAALGYLHPIFAGIAMALSSISVVLNALHLSSKHLPK